jgi:hypothetical protein
MALYRDSFAFLYAANWENSPLKSVQAILSAELEAVKKYAETQVCRL